MKSRELLKIFTLFFFALSVSAEDLPTVTDQSNLMLVVRTTFGANKVDTGLIPTGPVTFQDQNGNKQTIELAHFEYIGDTHIRFVFDSSETMANATPEEFKKFKLSAKDAVNLAIQNIHRDYGEPGLFKLGQGVYQVRGESPDFDSSYFLDENLWESLESHFQDTLIVAVPARHLLALAPETDKEAVSFLEDNVQTWFTEADTQQVSSALYSYKNGVWSVYQTPIINQ